MRKYIGYRTELMRRARDWYYRNEVKTYKSACLKYGGYCIPVHEIEKFSYDAAYDLRLGLLDSREIIVIYCVCGFKPPFFVYENFKCIENFSSFQETELYLNVCGYSVSYADGHRLGGYHDDFKLAWKARKTDG